MQLCIDTHERVKTYLRWNHVKRVGNEHVAMDNMSWTSMTKTCDMSPATRPGQAWPWHPLPFNWLTSLSNDSSRTQQCRLRLTSNLSTRFYLISTLGCLFQSARNCWKSLISSLTFAVFSVGVSHIFFAWKFFFSAWRCVTSLCLTSSWSG